jgi:SAM-dependent methyltransferase
VLAVPVAERVVLELFRRFPPRTTIFLAPEGRAESEYEDEVRFGFHRFFGLGQNMYAGLDVLDLGCGFGGRTVRFEELGARTVTGVEIDAAMVEHCRVFAAARGAAARFVTGSGEALPLGDHTLDLVVMNDVMEHVVDPARVLAECARVLRPGGLLATVFPPYYDVSSGSHLHGYATRLAGLNAVVPTRVLKAAARRRLEEQRIDYRLYFREVPTDKLWNQNGLTIRGFNRLLRRAPFTAEQIWHLGHRDHRLLDPPPRGLRRAAFVPFELSARTPFLQELFCLRVCAILRRDAPAASGSE